MIMMTRYLQSAEARRLMELARFMAVGATGSVLFVGLSTLTAHLTAAPTQLIPIGVHAGLVPVMFWAQRHLTFRSTGDAWPEFMKYALLQIASIVAASGVFSEYVTYDWRLNLVVFTMMSVASALVSYTICRVAIFTPAIAEGVWAGGNKE